MCSPEPEISIRRGSETSVVACKTEIMFIISNQHITALLRDNFSELSEHIETVIYFNHRAHISFSLISCSKTHIKLMKVVEIFIVKLILDYLPVKLVFLYRAQH